MSGGLVHMTNGVAALGLRDVHTIFEAVSKFSSFNADNDPWNEHDCAVMEVSGERII